jgi:hypothetical protein
MMLFAKWDSGRWSSRSCPQWNPAAVERTSGAACRISAAVLYAAHMRCLLRVHLLFSVLTVLLRSQPTPDACPVFTPDESISRITPKDRVFRFEGGYVAVVNEIRLDTDGSPVAYHPLNKGTTNLCNGLDPIIDGKRIFDKKAGSPCFAAVRAAIDAGWRREASPGFCLYGFYAPGTESKDLKCTAWGGAFGTGEIPHQGEGDPAPGFFISMTAAANPGRAPEDSQHRYLDSDRTPYVVIPGALVRSKSLPASGVAWAWNPKSNRSAAAVFGDTQSKFGEISVAFAQKIEKGRMDPIASSALTGESPIPWPYGKRSTGEVRLIGSPTGPVVFVYFSQAPSPRLASYDPDTIESATAAFLRRFGGPDHLQSCLKPLLH